MSVTKAVLLTLLILVIEAGIILTSLFVFDSKNAHIHGISVIIARVVAYSAVFILFWRSNDKKGIFQFSTLKPVVILLLLLLIVATEFVFRPFIDFDRILMLVNKQELPNYNYSFQGFTAKQIYSTITALIVAPILEELFFRKFLITELLKKYSLPITLVVSSFLFSIIHYETPVNLLPAFLFALLSGILYFKTKQITYSVLLHFFANTASLILAIKGEAYYEWLSWLNFGYLYWTLFITGIILCLGILKYILLITRQPVKLE